MPTFIVHWEAISCGSSYLEAETIQEAVNTLKHDRSRRIFEDRPRPWMPVSIETKEAELLVCYENDRPRYIKGKGGKE